MSEKSNSFAKNVSGFAFASLVTKLLGYARDALLVAIFGGGALTDAYYAAFRLVNVFRRTAGEGAINAAFIPLLEKERAKSEEDAKAFFSSVWTLILCASAALALAGIVLRRPLVRVFTGGFAANPEQLALTALLTAVLMPHLIFVNAAALLQAALNAARRFFAPALAPAVFSLSLIACLLFMRAGFAASLGPAQKITLLAAVASASGLAQLAILAPMMRKEGYCLGLSAPGRAINGAQALALAMPAAAALAQDQLSMLINTVYASFLAPGSVTAVYNAARIVQFPVSLFAASAAAVSLPELSRMAAGSASLNNSFAVPRLFEAPGKTLELAFKTTALILLPAAIGLLFLNLSVSRALFEHGRFTYEQSALTSQAILFLALGLPAFGANKIAVSAFYGAGKNMLPIKVLFFQLCANALLGFALMRTMGLKGLMLATSLSSWGAAVFLLSRLEKATGFSGFADRRTFLKIAAAALAMGLAVLAVKLSFERFLSPAAMTALGVASGLAVYFLALKALGCSDRKLVTRGMF